MSDYSFETLSPTEFENLSRDLLQKELAVNLESFTSGRDEGIDLRYAAASTGEVIVQCKRHLKSGKSLITHLKNKELSKVQRLKPKRYILTTSVGLTPSNKREIVKLFQPYINSSADIYGRNDLNNLLGKYPDVEKQHYKLWLSSTNILQQILHTDIVNRTAFEEEEIKEVVSLYVENDSYQEALDIFSKNHFVIISGIPGIGKTTLARMMVYRLLADEKFEQFVYISRGVEEAIKLYVPDKKQLFFFDDFLGRNYFEKGFDRNEDNDLIKFIERISSSKNKGLILTTREYIIRQAQQQYASLNAKLVTRNKYVIDLEKYTKTIRAMILYNHLFSYGVPYAYLATFLDDKTYEYIITHENYTPRLIETILKEKPWEDIAPKKFPETIKNYFDEPNKLWQDAYTNGISENARNLLKILFVIKTPISIQHLYTAFDASHRDLPNRPDYHIFERTIKELENTFIDIRSSYRPPEGTMLIVDYKNPSIFDFLLEYFVDFKRNDLLSAIKYPVYIDQLILRFSAESATDLSGQIIMTQEISDSLKESILSGFDRLPFGEEDSISQYSLSTRSYSIKTYPQVLNKILKDMAFLNDPKLHDKLFKSYLKFNESNESGDFDSQFYLLELFEPNMTDQQITLAISAIVNSISSMNDYEWFTSYYNNDRIYNIMENWVETDASQLNERAVDVAIEELQDLELEELERHESTIDYYHTSLGLDVTEINEAYEEALSEARKVSIDEYDYDDLSPGPAPSVEKPIDEASAIRHIFDSLRQN